MGNDKLCVNRCFKCGGVIKPEDDVVFTVEWDAFCHAKCCPKFNPKAKPIRECYACM